jgi:hypothetical protein
MPGTRVSYFQLRQNGEYVCRTMFSYMDQDGEISQSRQTPDQLPARDHFIDPGSLGAPAGSTVWFYLWVLGSPPLFDQSGTTAFIYDPAVRNFAHYTCSGTTTNVGLLQDALSIADPS